MSRPPSSFARLWLAIVCWFRIVFDPRFAAQVAALRSPDALPARAEGTPLPPPSGEWAEKAAPALYLLSLLQREGRLIDFCEEELAGFSDAQVGAAARTVHDGCRKALRDAFTFAPVRSESEGAGVTLQPGFDARSVRLTGNLSGAPPFSGVLRHHGWKVTEARMPASPARSTVVAPAEVELP
jgi:hypothetical protein